MATWTNKSRNNASFNNKLRLGKEPSMEALEDYKFTDDAFDEDKELQDYTFDELGSTEWTNKSKTLRDAGFDVSTFDTSVFDDEGGHDNVWITRERN